MSMRSFVKSNLMSLSLSSTQSPNTRCTSVSHRWADWWSKSS